MLCLDSDELRMEAVMLNIRKTQTLGNTCNCLPACISLQYDAETSQAHFNWIKMLEAIQHNMTEFKRSVKTVERCLVSWLSNLVDFNLLQYVVYF